MTPSAWLRGSADTKSINTAQRYSQRGVMIEDHVYVAMHRDGEVIDLFVNYGPENRPTRVCIQMTVSDLIELLGGNITPPELNRAYGPREGGSIRYKS